MAEKPVKQNLPADLPENWTDSQYVSPGGTEVGLTKQHGFNYLMQQVNNSQKAVKEINEAFPDLASLNAEGKIPSSQLPDMNYQTKTENLPSSSSIALGDTIPFYSVQSAENKRITIAALKNALGVPNPIIAVTALRSTSLVCSDGTTTLNGTGTTEFSLPNTGTWTITATTGSVVATEQVEASRGIRYTVDMRLATGIEVTTAPTNVSYIVGDTINITGAVVTATFQDGTTEDITDKCDYFPTVATEGTNVITFTATFGGQEFSATTPISIINATLANNTWAGIKKVSDEGKGANYWKVGDTKARTIKGTVADMPLNVTVNAFILGFNHNSAKEGNNRIHFQIGKIGTTDIALVDSNYGSTGTFAGFRMNTSNINSGGWNGSYGRKTLLGNSGNPSSPPSSSLLAALPADLLAVMKSVAKYTDNTGNSSNTSGNVTATTDYLFFLAEFEVHGARFYANQYEQNSQAQYDYYKAGNSKIKYKHNATTTDCYWWCRSAYYDNSLGFCFVNSNGGASAGDANHSNGLAPGFCV